MIQVFYLNRKVEKVDFSRKTLKALNKHNKTIWVDMINPSLDELEAIRDIFGLHPLTVEDLHTRKSRVKVEEFKHYLYIVLYGIMKHREVELNEIDFVLGKNFLISSHLSDSEMFQKIEMHEERLRHLMKKGPDFLLHDLIDSELENYYPVLEKVDEKIDRLEEDITENPEQEHLNKLLELKRKILGIKRIAIAQQDKLALLARGHYAIISKESLAYFRDAYDHSVRVSDKIENYREAILGTFDAHMSSLSNKMNEVMKMLSIIATIMLPLTFITGIYGMNFLNLPGAKETWGFWGVIAFMFGLGVFMLIVFRIKKWI
ncbi:magnesium/cobalt transporter CorA [Nanoarchaeota archaeon]